MWPILTLLRHISFQSLTDFTWILQGDSRSNVMVLFDSPYVGSYWRFIATHGLTRLLYQM